MPNGLVGLLNWFSGPSELEKFEANRCGDEIRVELEKVILTARCRKDRGHNEGPNVDVYWHRYETLDMKIEWLSD